MMLSPRRHELLSVILLGVGTAIIFCGYDVQAFFAEGIIHSLNKKYPEAISQYAGYYGLARLSSKTYKWFLDKRYIILDLDSFLFSQLLWTV